MIFFAKIGSENTLNGQLALIPEPIGLYAIQFNSIVENDGELVLMVLNAYFMSQQQYFLVYALFLALPASI